VDVLFEFQFQKSCALSPRAQFQRAKDGDESGDFTLFAAAGDYLRKGWLPIPIPPDEKVPRQTDWPNPRLCDIRDGSLIAVNVRDQVLVTHDSLVTFTRRWKWLEPGAHK